MYEALTKLRSISATHQLSMEEASLRWLVYHSALRAQDSIILGASKNSQVEGNMEAINKGPLADGVVGELNALWEIVEKDAMGINP